MHLGYARVSTGDQNPDLQLTALRQAGCTRLFTDTATGAHIRRPELTKCLKALTAGDTLTVWKLDRLGRSLRDLISLLDELKARGVAFRSLTEAIDTTTPAGRFFFHVMASLAQMERELIVERTPAGLAAARQRGRVGGRRRRMTPSKVELARALLAGGMPPREVAHHLGVSAPTLYRWLPAGARDAGNPT